MLVSIQTKLHARTISLSEHEGVPCCIADHNGINLVQVEFKKGQIKLQACTDIILNDAHNTLTVSVKKPTMIAASKGDDSWLLLFRKATPGDKTTRLLGFTNNALVSIGRNDRNTFVYESEFISGLHAELKYENKAFFLRDVKSANGVYVNGSKIKSDSFVPLQIADTVGVLDLRICIGSNFISVNNPQNALRINQKDELIQFVPQGIPAPVLWEPKNYPDHSVAPRYPQVSELKKITIKPPQQVPHKEQQPILLRIGPSFVMGISSIIAASMFFTASPELNSSSYRSIPMLVAAVAMLVGSIVWPLFSSKYENEQQYKITKKYKSLYSNYLSRIQEEIQHEKQVQKNILEQSCPSSHSCYQLALIKDHALFGKLPLHHDFLQIRLGLGDVPANFNIIYSQDISAETEDEMDDIARRLASSPILLENAPVTCSVLSKIIGVAGEVFFVQNILKHIFTQIVSLHSPLDVKVVLFLDKYSSHSWKHMRSIPHVWNESEHLRSFSVTTEDIRNLDSYLARLLEHRQSDSQNANCHYHEHLVLFAMSSVAQRTSQSLTYLKKISNLNRVTVFFTAPEVSLLPAHCNPIISQRDGMACLTTYDDGKCSNQVFLPDAPLADYEERHFASALANMAIDKSNTFFLPQFVPFSKLFSVDTVDQLNICDRWAKHNTSLSLSTEIGLNESGMPLYLDLHESNHGPHGLIAGTTGSGKSEFLTALILSYAINYSPEEINFVLIDYKGGGLAHAFSNSINPLPHLAGAITNLDGSDILRGLWGIENEIKRRQALFAQAKIKTGNAQIDIYTYNNLYKQGKINAPCPHLILIADEFAELKQHEPEFMDHLISISRIGRSLGIHLILATQKPAGVVNDQIWSNARFKIALKVADPQDSHDILKRPEAATLTVPGRFYFLVGNNESFQLGQSGFTGALALSKEEQIQQNQTIEYISNTGQTLLTNALEVSRTECNSITQLSVVLKLICDAAQEAKMKAEMLWLPALPQKILLQDIESMAQTTVARTQSHSPVYACGMIDCPHQQTQEPLLFSPFDGNILLYGMADAGVEHIVHSMVLSAITHYQPSHVHFYILDFGTQSFKVFTDVPHVGDVVYIEEKEKIVRFFSWIRDCTLDASKKSLSTVIIINGVGNFLETYPALEDSLLSFLRESTQLGIQIIAAAETVNAIRVKLKSYFSIILACGLPDENDYRSLFNLKTSSRIPRGFARGLVKNMHGIFEFQGAYGAQTAQEESEYISATVKQKGTNQDQLCAPSIPVPPPFISPLDLSFYNGNNLHVPIGIFDDSLEHAFLNFEQNCMQRILFQKKSCGAEFIQGVINSEVKRNVRDVALFDYSNYLESVFLSKKHILTSLPDVDDLCKSSSCMEDDRLTLVFVSGISSFLQSLSFADAEEYKTTLERLSTSSQFRLVLFDLVNEATYTFDDWFNRQLSKQTALWVGPGIESQSFISGVHSFFRSSTFRLKNNQGFLIEEGVPRFVHLVSQTTNTDERSSCD